MGHQEPRVAATTLGVVSGGGLATPKILVEGGEGL
jgi:hypothetical protein